MKYIEYKTRNNILKKKKKIIKREELNIKEFRLNKSIKQKNEDNEKK